MHNGFWIYGGKYVFSTGDDCHLFPLFLIGKWRRHYCTVHIKDGNKINPTSYSLAQLHSFAEAITDDWYLRLYTICCLFSSFLFFF